MMLDCGLERIDALLLVDPEALSAAQTQLYEQAKVTEDLVFLRSVCSSTLCLKERIKRAQNVHSGKGDTRSALKRWSCRTGSTN
jgi:hypothetical protein